jgi:hypothetical protein
MSTPLIFIARNLTWERSRPGEGRPARLSEACPLWQSHRADGSGPAMPRFAILVSLGLALPISGAAAAAPGGRLATLPVGEYRCELPGDATGPSGRPVSEETFAIRNASTYVAAEGAGSYLLTGDRLVMTSGPRRGDRYRRVSNNFLRKLDAAGAETGLRCVRRTTYGQ